MPTKELHCRAPLAAVALKKRAVEDSGGEY